MISEFEIQFRSNIFYTVVDFPIPSSLVSSVSAELHFSASLDSFLLSRVILSLLASSSSSLSETVSMTVARDSCDLKKYWFDKPRAPGMPKTLPESLPVGVVLIIPVTECDRSCFCCPRRCQAVDSSPQSSESYSESDGPPPSLSDISTATRRANIVATSVWPLAASFSASFACCLCSTFFNAIPEMTECCF